METSKRITVEEALEMIANRLNSLCIPVSQMQQIGIPVAQCVEDLCNCIDAIRSAGKPVNPDDIPGGQVIDLGELTEAKDRNDHAE